jgi:hypothetical protein
LPIWLIRITALTSTCRLIKGNGVAELVRG